MRIALLEDDPSQSDLVRFWLAGAGHVCHAFDRSREFIRTLARDSFDILVLDWELPDVSGDETAVFDLEFRREVFLWAAAKVRESVTPTTWQAFWQTSVESRPIAGVAQSLGITVGSTYIARSRVMAKLREEASRYCAATEVLQ